MREHLAAAGECADGARRTAGDPRGACGAPGRVGAAVRRLVGVHGAARRRPCRERPACRRRFVSTTRRPSGAASVRRPTRDGRAARARRRERVHGVARAAAASCARRATTRRPASRPAAAAIAQRSTPEPQAGLTSVGARHLERSKLVVLGLATKEPGACDATGLGLRARARDVAVERHAAVPAWRPRSGADSLAGVMRDLELVLLQTSMAEETDAAALPQIQRLIRKRGLVEKMDVVGTTGLVP